MGAIEHNLKKINDTQQNFKNITTSLQKHLLRIHKSMTSPDDMFQVAKRLEIKNVLISGNRITFEYMSYQFYIEGLIDLKNWLLAGTLQGYIDWGIILMEDSTTEYYSLSKDRLLPKNPGIINITTDIQYTHILPDDKEITEHVLPEEFEEYIVEKIYTVLLSWTKSEKYYDIQIEFEK